MKNWKITDGLQIILAIVLTGSMAYAMQPTALEPAQAPQKAEVAQVTVSKPKATPDAQETANNKQTETAKPTTWQDNPNKCDQTTHYIAAEEPYECLKKTNNQNQSAGTAATTSARASAISGNKQTWLAASGIPQSQWSYVDQIVSRESGWNPCAYNPGKSDCNANPTSACGLAQSLPCGKQSKYGHWTDPVANLKWQYEYVTARYGGYAQAVAFWNANHWY